MQLQERLHALLGLLLRGAPVQSVEKTLDSAEELHGFVRAVRSFSALLSPPDRAPSFVFFYFSFTRVYACIILFSPTRPTFVMTIDFGGHVLFFFAQANSLLLMTNQNINKRCTMYTAYRCPRGEFVVTNRYYARVQVSFDTGIEGNTALYTLYTRTPTVLHSDT